MITSVCPSPAFPSVLDSYTWIDSHNTFHKDSYAWQTLPSPPKPAVCSRATMEQSQSSSMPAGTAELGSELQVQLDLFRKLGFSLSQVRAVLLKLGLHADTNRVLEELIQAGAEAEEREDKIASPPLVSRSDTNTIVPNNVITNGPIAVSLPTEQEDVAEEDNSLKPIVIDGSNVAMSHGNKEVFSCLGIQLAVKYFLDRGHTDITVFVPSWRREQPRPDVPITDQHILRELEKRKILVFTPSRRVAGKRVVCYDDRFIVKLAYEVDGIIVSNDTYRDLQGEKPEWKRFIEERLLMYSFVNDKFMPPDDPLGRHGPTLDNFLRKTPRAPKRLPCPYGKKCTYGFKCKFNHPERAKHSHRSLADELREKAKVGVPPHRRQSAGHVSARCSSLGEVLEQKLTLDSKGTHKKAHTSENVPVLKSTSQPTQRKFPPKRQTSNSLTGPPSSQERMDSGLGSYECNFLELHSTNCDHVSGREHTKSKGHSGGRQRHVPSGGSQPCSCCSLQSLNCSSGFQQHHSMGLASSQNPGMTSYCQPRYHSYGGGPAYPITNMPQYSLPHDYRYNMMPPPPPQQQHGYWSKPYGDYSHPDYSHPSHIQGENTTWGPATAAKAGPLIPEREQIRKKLRAVFNTSLVERAMDMFPNIKDPQKLAVEILNLQSCEGVL